MVLLETFCLFVCLCIHWHFQIADYFSTRSEMYDIKRNQQNSPTYPSQSPEILSQFIFFLPIFQSSYVCPMYDVPSVQQFLEGEIGKNVSTSWKPLTYFFFPEGSLGSQTPKRRLCENYLKQCQEIWNQVFQSSNILGGLHRIIFPARGARSLNFSVSQLMVSGQSIRM